MTKSIFPKYPPVSVKVGFLLELAGQRHYREIAAALKPYGITPVYCQILLALSHLSELGLTTNQNQLIKFSELNKSMVSTVLQKMEHNGFVERFDDPSDSRAKNIALTAKGWEAAKQTYHIVEEVDSRLFGQCQIDLEPLAEMLYGILDKPNIRCSNDPKGQSPERETHPPAQAHASARKKK